MEHTPWVTFAGLHNPQAEKDLLKTVCESMHDPQPAGCANVDTVSLDAAEDDVAAEDR